MGGREKGRLAEKKEIKKKSCPVKLSEPRSLEGRAGGTGGRKEGWQDAEIKIT